jgi:hypothetical protein
MRGSPRWVIEESYQIPFVRNTAPQVLSTGGGNLLIAIRYLY